MKLPKPLASLLPNLDAEGNPIRTAWDTLARVPGGAKLFSKFVGFMVPYTGTIDAEVLELRAGYARVEMRDKPGLRNHLKSVHAIALANLAELTGNIAIFYSMPDDARFIVSGFTIEYLKKSRGTIVAESAPPVPETSEKQEYPVDVTLRDATGDVVAKVTLRTLVGPKKKA